MARTNIASQIPVGPYPAGGAVGAAALDITMTAADTSMHNEAIFSGRDLLIVQNTDSASHNLTITSAPDEHGRSTDIATYAVGAGKISVFSFRNGAAGWQQADGHIYFQGDSAMLFFAVLASTT
jgi:hypothetical protein